MLSTNSTMLPYRLQPLQWPIMSSVLGFGKQSAQPPSLPSLTLLPNSPMLQWASIDPWICTALHCLPSLAFCQEPSQLWKSCTSPEPNLFFAPLLFLLLSLLHSLFSSPCSAIFFMPESAQVFTNALALRVIVFRTGWSAGVWRGGAEADE